MNSRSYSGEHAMLIRTSGELISDLFLLTLGESSHYYLDIKSPILFDCSASFQLPALLKRLDSLHLPIPERIFLTHPYTERVSAIPLLRKLNPKLTLYATRETADYLGQAETAKDIFNEDQQLSDRFGSNITERYTLSELTAALKVDHYIRPGDTITLGAQSRLRVQSASGYTPYSIAYLYEPAQYLIGDNGFGYFRDQLLSAPGADHCLTTAQNTIERFINLNIAGLCLPLRGVISGNLVKRHLSNLIRNVQDLKREYCEAVHSGVSESEIRQSVIDSFYSAQNKDAFVEHLYQRSFNSVWKQLVNSKG